MQKTLLNTRTTMINVRIVFSFRSAVVDDGRTLKVLLSFLANVLNTEFSWRRHAASRENAAPPPCKTAERKEKTMRTFIIVVLVLSSVFCINILNPDFAERSREIFHQNFGLPRSDYAAPPKPKFIPVGDMHRPTSSGVETPQDLFFIEIYVIRIPCGEAETCVGVSEQIIKSATASEGRDARI
ncbi:MAG: hypothetical protein AAGJ87_07600, partial [Pseudomonadota bacterium]